VLVDGVVVGHFTPSDTAYQNYSTAAFTVAAGSHTIAFQGLDTAGGDNTAFIDDVATASIPAIGDQGFEQVVVGAGHFQFDPTGSPWAFSGGTGISGNNSGFTAGIDDVSVHFA
jgi:cell surface hyaluronidase